MLCRESERGTNCLGKRTSERVHIRTKDQTNGGGRMDFGQLDLEMSGEEVSKPHLSPIHRWHNVHRSFYSQFHDIEGI